MGEKRHLLAANADRLGSAAVDGGTGVGRPAAPRDDTNLNAKS